MPNNISNEVDKEMYKRRQKEIEKVKRIKQESEWVEGEKRKVESSNDKLVVEFANWVIHVVLNIETTIIAVR